MDAAVLSIGSELLRGDIVDTNATFLTRELSQLGFHVRRVEQIGDVLAELTGAVTETLGIAPVLVCTGGLGPTQDDLTREAIAAAFGETLYEDAELVRVIESRFASLHRRMTPNNRRQAQLIPSAEAISNPNGTAPGWYARKGEHIVVAMPGPPGEMQPMWHDAVEPRLEKLFSGATTERALMTFGLGESMLEHRIADIIGLRPDVTIATYAKSAGVEVHITARAGSRREAEALAAEAESSLRERLGRAVFGTGRDTLATAVGHLLTEQSLTLAAMESCTGGELSSLLTSYDGSSDAFVGGIVAYSRAVKEANGVPADVIVEHGMYSAETATAMAAAARRVLGADVGIGVTGVAGTEPENGTPPGTCFIAVSLNGADRSAEIHRPGQRDVIKRYFAQCALDLLRRELEERTGLKAG